MDSGEMPYGVQKARDGDPYEWVAQNLQSHLGGGGIVGGNPDEDYGLERESVMHGDYAEEAREPHSVDGGMDNPLIQDEGAVGAIAGEILAPELGPLAPVIGSAVGDAISPDDEHEVMPPVDDNDVEESSPLAGQYGHSGKMKEVGKETSFLDRLKELSGMIRN
jgi:hypothetical protein